MKTLRKCTWAAVIAVGVASFAAPLLEVRAQNGAPANAKGLDKTAYDALHDVITQGAELFNIRGDYAGCYHTFRAGLITVKPFLSHHPDLQRTIDDGLARAEERNRVVARAFVLRRVLGDVRKQLEQRSGPFTAIASNKTLEPRKSIAENRTEKHRETDKKHGAKIEESRENKSEKKSAKKSSARLSGKILLQGRPVTGDWYVTLVSDTVNQSFSTYVHADGSYGFRMPIPAGSYKVAIEEGPRDRTQPAGAGVVVPKRYQNPVTSGLNLQIEPGKQTHDLNLQ